MNLFGRKSAREAVRPAQGKSSTRAAAAHYLTLDLSRAMDLAAMLANSRAARFIEIPDLLAGLYIYEWDRLSQYWPEENRDQVEEMLRDICQISPQRWNYWIAEYDAQRKAGEPVSGWKRFHKTKAVSQAKGLPTPSVGLKSVLDVAEVVSPFRDPRRDLKESDETAVPVLTSECMLLCIVKFVASATGRKLAESGLDTVQLERAVLDPKRSPLR